MIPALTLDTLWGPFTLPALYPYDPSSLLAALQAPQFGDQLVRRHFICYALQDFMAGSVLFIEDSLEAQYGKTCLDSVFFHHFKLEGSYIWRHRGGPELLRIRRAWVAHMIESLKEPQP